MDVWPFIPQRGATEALEWLTDVIRCRSKEYRQCLRAAPRQDWTCDYHMTPGQFARAKEMAKKIGGAELYLPVRTEASEVGDVAADTVSLGIDATGKCYAEGGKLLLWESDSVFEVVTIAEIGAGTIGFLEATEGSYTRAVAMPLRVATFAQEFEADRGEAVSAIRTQARFQAVQTEDLSAGAGLVYPTYRGSPIVTDATRVRSGVREQYTREVETLDSGTGGIAREPVYSRPSQTSVLSWYAEGAAAVAALRVWLHTRKGRWRDLWAASWNRDLTVVDSISAGSQQVRIAAMGFGDVFSLPCDFLLITKSGAFLPFRVTAVADGDPGVEVLTTSTLFVAGVTIEPDDVKGVCRLVLSRFDADRVEIQHGEASSARVTVPIVEVPT